MNANAIARKTGGALVLSLFMEGRVPGLIVVGMVVAGGLYFAETMVSNRNVLETKPGEVGAFCATTLAWRIGKSVFVAVESRL